MEPIKTEAYLSGVSTRADRSLGVRFTTQEITPEDGAKWLSRNGDFGWLIFVPNEAKEIELPKVDAEASGKTSSQRLRGVLYKLYQQTQDVRTVDFEAWYRMEMNRIIDHEKAKLDGD